MTTNEIQKLVSASLIGGLGNNLFQLAAAFGYAKRTGRKCVIHIPSIERTFHQPQHCELYENTVFAKFERTTDSYNDKVDEDKKQCFTYNDIPISDANHLHLHGFFQHQKYVDHVRKEFLGSLVLPLENVATFPDYCFIHVRRGDYLRFPQHYVDLYTTYIPSAMALVRSKHPGVRFIVFSDDIPWCMQYNPFQEKDVHFCNETDTVTSLVLMSKCWLGGICANSSFSWWGAYMNENPNKIIIFPNKWYNGSDETPIDIQIKGSIILNV